MCETCGCGLSAGAPVTVSGHDHHEIVFVIAQRLAQGINAFFGITIADSRTFSASTATRSIQ